MGKVIVGGTPAPKIKKMEIREEMPVELPISEVKIETVERLVEVPVDRIIKEMVYVDKPVEIIKEVIIEKPPVEIVKFIEKQVEVIKEVPYEKVVYVDKPVEIIKEVIIEKEKEIIKKIVPKWAMVAIGVELIAILLLLIK